MKEIKVFFDKLGSKALFDFYESSFYDSACGQDIVRVYAVSKNDLLKGGFKQDWKVWLGFG